MATYEFLTLESKIKNAIDGSGLILKKGSEVASTLFRGYRSDGSPLPTIFADEIGWSIYDAAGTVLKAITKIGDTVIGTTEDLIKYIALLPTSGEVTDTLRAKDAMMFRGVAGEGFTSTLGTTEVGDTYKVGANGWITTSDTGVISWSANKPETGNSLYVEAGDMIICLTTTESQPDKDGNVTTTGATWNIIQTNLTLTKLTFKNSEGTSLLEYDTVSPYSVKFSNAFEATMSGTELTVNLAKRTTTGDNPDIESKTLDPVQAGATANSYISSLSFDDYGRINGYTVTPFTVGPNKLYVTDQTTVATANVANKTNPYLQSVYDGVLGSTIQFLVADNCGLEIKSTASGLKFSTLKATSSVLGSVKPLLSYSGTYTAVTGTTAPEAIGTDSAGNSKAIVNKITTTQDRFYAVTTDSLGHMFVNVPWTDTDTTVSANFTKDNSIEIAKFGPEGSLSSVYVPYASSSLYGVVKIGDSITSVSGYESVKVKDGVLYAKTNTWRSVYAWLKDLINTANDTIDEALADAIGTASLAFSSKFVYSNKEIVIGKDANNADIKKNIAEIDILWAEVDSTGNITYR